MSIQIDFNWKNPLYVCVYECMLHLNVLMLSFLAKCRLLHRLTLPLSLFLSSFVIQCNLRKSRHLPSTICILEKGSYKNESHFFFRKKYIIILFCLLVLTLCYLLIFIFHKLFSFVSWKRWKRKKRISGAFWLGFFLRLHCKIYSVSFAFCCLWETTQNWPNKFNVMWS